MKDHEQKAFAKWNQEPPHGKKWHFIAAILMPLSRSYTHIGHTSNEVSFFPTDMCWSMVLHDDDDNFMAFSIDHQHKYSFFLHFNAKIFFLLIDSNANLRWNKFMLMHNLISGKFFFYLIQTVCMINHIHLLMNPLKLINGGFFSTKRKRTWSKMNFHNKYTHQLAHHKTPCLDCFFCRASKISLSLSISKCGFKKSEIYIEPLMGK